MPNRPKIFDELDRVAPLIPTPVYWLDTNYVIAGGNDLCLSAIGSDKATMKEALIGKTYYDYYPKEIADELTKMVSIVLETGRATKVEEKITDVATGNFRYYETARAPLFGDDGSIIGTICTAIEITELKQTQHYLEIAKVEAESAKERAEAANYIMTEFIANMGHDLVTPFSTITGTASILLYRYSDKYLELKPYFEDLIQGCTNWEIAYHSTIKATSITEMEIKPETFSINKELMTIESIMRPNIGSKNLQLTVLPFEPLDEDVIETDRLKFHLILIDLISNAIKFTEKGQVTVSIYKKDGMFNIAVSDTGIGIPADKFDYIFELYTKLSRSNKYGANFQGVGAGLFLARYRARLLGAKISVASELGKGSTFTLSIPSKLPTVS